MNQESKKYWCPTHPEIQSDDPNAICAKCGTMKLIPREESKHPIPKIKRKAKDFLPVTVIFLIIVLFTFFMTLFVHSELEFGMRMFMGTFFLIFGFFKVISLRKFADAYSTYDILAMRSRVYAFVYPFLEILLAFLYLANVGSIYRDVFTLVLMVVSSIGVIKKLRAREEIPCACLGMVFILPMTWVTLSEDLIMAVEAMIMIVLFTS